MRISCVCVAALLLSFVAPFARADTLNSTMPKDQLVESVLRLLTDPDGYGFASGNRLERQGEVRYALGLLQDDASAVLVDALRSYEMAARYNAAHLLQSFGDESARDALRTAFLAEPHVGARRMMTRAMEKLSPVAAADMLTESLAGAPAKDIYDDRIQGLLRLGDARALPHVGRFASAAATPDRAAALAALFLVEAGDRDGIPVLQKFYAGLPPTETASNPWPHARVITALTALQEQNAIPAATTGLRASPSPATAYRVVGRLGSELVPHLLSGPADGHRMDPAHLHSALRTIHTGDNRPGQHSAPPSVEHVGSYAKYFLDPANAVGPTDAARATRSSASSLPTYWRRLARRAGKL